MNISKEQYEESHAQHIQLWDWCFHHPSKEKDDCPMWEWNSGTWEAVRGNCFACEVAHSICNFAPCSRCPMDAKICYAFFSYYDKWESVKSPKTSKKYAALIRDAKWMPYEEWIKLRGKT